MKTGDVYHSIRQELHDAYGDYGVGVLRSSLMGTQAEWGTGSLASLLTLETDGFTG